ncbi:hypothetical protein [Stenotrophomonas sp. PD6]|uniref:hypothetical protein n=1 Tax=Stenotrophomonas sp. PD6 TaxID=3368612 RepID=UPI003B9E3E9A
MRWNRPVTLAAPVEAALGSRPIKIAYLVPLDTPETAQLILDGVFFESYSRWAGARTLMVPIMAGNFQDEGFKSWLVHFDPDFIYTYSNLASDLVEEIDRLCSPVALLAHRHDYCEVDRGWRSYLPRWEHYFRPMPSISTARSPDLYRISRQDRRQPELMLFTQYNAAPTNRTLADNFGVSLDLHHVMHEVAGLYRTLCLTPIELPENLIAGSERCTSVADAFAAIAEHRVATVSQLATAHSEAVAQVHHSLWADTFRIFVGTSPLERINFWNCRSICAGTSHAATALIVDESFFVDAPLLQQLGKYLNKNNFVRQGGGQNLVSLHSSEYSQDALNSFATSLRACTWNSVSVPSVFDKAVIFEPDETVHEFPALAASAAVKISETFTQFRAEEPEHLSFLDPRFKSVGRGQWMVEIAIERHNSLSKYSDVVDTWELPNRNRVTRAFTERLARATRQCRLALLPTSKEPLYGRGLATEPWLFDISLPSDETFFRYLALNFHQYPSDDLRASLAKSGYAEIRVSDKGQNLRGVIAMFGQLSVAYEVIGNAYWRRVLDAATEGAARPRTFTLGKLRSMAVDDKDSVARVAKISNFRDSKEAQKYLRSGLLDTLENLVRSKVFFQVFNWRCNYCGHANSKMFDLMCIENQCSICSTVYLAPIDLDWEFELNEFVYRSLRVGGGLPVLWTLGHLLDRTFSGSFWFLPEVDIYLEHGRPEKNEIDALCMLGGKFYAIEVKRSVSLFLNVAGSIEKFCSIVERLRPDVAMLSFERYTLDGEDSDLVKERLENVTDDIRARIAPWTKLEVLVAQDFDGFNDVPYDLGWGGPRIRSLVAKQAGPRGG